MNEIREQWLKDIEQADLELFEKIKDNPRPDVSDLWALSEKRFIEWRKIHDFPRLLAHFDKTLKRFKEWKEENNLTNEIIIGHGQITPFIEHKRFETDDKRLYLTKQIYDGQESTFVSYDKREGDEDIHGLKFKFEVLQPFISYLDWLKAKGEQQEILYINSRSAPGHEAERVWIHKDISDNTSDFELLKMGGISLPTKGHILHRGKKIEFANLCGLKLKGEIYSGEMGNLECSYCACDNWVAVDISMPLLVFSHCTVGNFSLTNSKLEGWKFYDSKVSGDFVNTKLFHVNIFGGIFNPVMQGCTLFNTHAEEEPNLANANLLSAYRLIKKIYQGQGDDDIAKVYFVKEHECLRKQLKGWSYVANSVGYYYWEYGSKPNRIIYYSVGIIIFFGLIYWFANDLVSANNKDGVVSLWDGLYFSTVTFTTLGYGDLSPTGWLRILCALEAFSGLVNMGFLIAGYSSKKY